MAEIDSKIYSCISQYKPFIDQPHSSSLQSSEIMHWTGSAYMLKIKQPHIDLMMLLHKDMTWEHGQISHISAVAYKMLLNYDFDVGQNHTHGLDNDTGNVCVSIARRTKHLKLKKYHSWETEVHYSSFSCWVTEGLLSRVSGHQACHKPWPERCFIVTFSV